MMHLAAGARSRVDARAWPPQVYGEMLAAGYGVVGEFHYVHHQPDGTPYEDPNALARSPRRVAAAIDVGAPAAIIVHGWDGRTCRPRRAARASATPTSRASWRASTRCATWADGRDGVSVGGRRAQRARGPARGSRRSPATPTTTASPPRPRPRAARASSTSAAPSTAARRSSCSSAPASWARATSVIHGIHVDERDIALLAEPETIVVSCPTTEGNLGDGYLPAMAYRDAGRAAGHRQRLAGAHRPVRGGARARDRRRAASGSYAPGAAGADHGDLWAELARNGLAQPRPATGGQHDRRRPRASRPARRRAATSCRWRWRRAPRPASSPVRPAACARAAAACRSGRPARAPAGR